MKFILIIIITMGAMGHTKTIEMKIPQENKKECLKFAKTFELKLPIAGIVMSMKSRCEPKIVWVKSKDKQWSGTIFGYLCFLQWEFFGSSSCQRSMNGLGNFFVNLWINLNFKIRREGFIETFLQLLNIFEC